MQAFARAMAVASLPGSIINISSITGKYGNIGQCIYCLKLSYNKKDSALAKHVISSTESNLICISYFIWNFSGQTNYTASKAGVVAMTQSAAKELGKSNIRYIVECKTNRHALFS